MFLHQNTDTDYVLVEADWPVEKALTLVQNLIPGHVILRREDYGNVYYYLFRIQEFQARLQTASPRASLKQALDLHEGDAAQTVPDTSTFDEAPSRAVVMSNDRLAGFWDRTAPKKRLFGATPAKVERTLKTDFPKVVPLNQIGDLKVSLSGVVGTGSSDFQAPPGAVLDILVETKTGFEVVGLDRGQLKVTDPPDNKVLTFELRGLNEGTGEIMVWARRNGVIQASQRLLSLVQANPPGAAVISHSETPVVSLSGFPDLTLSIKETPNKPGYSLEIFHPGYLGVQYGPISFRNDPGKYFETLYQDIEMYPVKTHQDKVDTMKRLETKGNQLFQDLLPEELRKILWRLREKIHSVLIQSSEPWIPWEICRLWGEVGGTIQEDKFWCEKFNISRSVINPLGQPVQLPDKLTLKKLATVVPSNSKLAWVQDELNYLQQELPKSGRSATPIPARSVDLLNALAGGSYDGWHFSGHGGFASPDPDRSEIKLEDRALHPDELTGRVLSLGRSKPLVFLNACQVGHGGMSLTGLGGWANRFLAAGAGAFIGPLWSVYDQPACDFAKNLYSELLAGKPIGEAVKNARLSIKQEEDPTWLAYSVFAYPLATVS